MKLNLLDVIFISSKSRIRQNGDKDIRSKNKKKKSK